MLLSEEVSISMIVRLISFLVSRKNVDESIVRNYYTSSMRGLWVSDLFFALSPLLDYPLDGEESAHSTQNSLKQ